MDLFEAHPKALADAIDTYMATENKTNNKEKAFEIGYNNFSPDILKQKYLDIISQI
jgi:hypothetical protein